MKREHKHFTLKGLICIGAGLLATTALPVFAHCANNNNSDNDNFVFAPVCSPLQKLRAEGVQVIHLGETYRIIISSTQLFNLGSAHLCHGAHHILKNVAHFLNHHHIISVKVAAYSDNWASARKKALTEQQAAKVQAYLTNRGLKARLIYADGQGDKNPVARNSTWMGRHANRRVEISFRYIPRKTIYE